MEKYLRFFLFLLIVTLEWNSYFYNSSDTILTQLLGILRTD